MFTLKSEWGKPGVFIAITFELSPAIPVSYLYGQVKSSQTNCMLIGLNNGFM